MVYKYPIFVFIFFLSFVLIPTEVSAQATDSAAPETKPSSVRERMAAEKQNLQEKRATIQKNREDIRASREDAMKEKRENLMEKIPQKRLEAQQKFQAKRAAFQQKVATIKDEKKRQLIEKIDTKMNTVNTNRTNRMSENLEKLTNILDGIQEKSALAKENGQNASAVDTAIARADTAIQAAKTAVETQAGKEYVITITATGSGQLRSTVGTATKQLQTDLSASHNLMVAAKQAVRQASLALTKTLGIPVEPTNANSATIVAP